MAKNPGFIISGIKETAYWFRTPKESITEEDSLHFSVENNINVHPEIHTVEVLVTIEINRDQKKSTPKRPPLLNYQVTFRFEVSGLDATVHPDEEPGYEYIQLPKGLSVALISATYSTCRGLLFARTAGSHLQDYLLPIANPVELATDIKDRIRKKVAEPSTAQATQKSETDNKVDA